MYNLYVETLTSEGRRERAGERGPPEVLDVRVAPGLPGDEQEDGRGQDCGHRHASCFRIVREMERAERQGSRSGNKHKIAGVSYVLVGFTRDREGRKEVVHREICVTYIPQD